VLVALSGCSGGGGSRRGASESVRLQGMPTACITRQRCSKRARTLLGGAEEGRSSGASGGARSV